MPSVTPQKLCLAVAKHAKGMGQYRRVCYVVVNIDSGRIEHVDNHFRTATEAKKHARKFGLNGYFYPIYERKMPIREFFPSATQIMKFLSQGAFVFFFAGTAASSRKNPHTTPAPKPIMAVRPPAEVLEPGLAQLREQVRCACAACA